jgi:hypothetical protein
VVYVGVAVVPSGMNSSSFSLHKRFDGWNAYAPQVVLPRTTCIEGDHYDDIQFWSILLNFNVCIGWSIETHVTVCTHGYRKS